MTGKAPRLTELKKMQLSRSKLELFCDCPQCFWLNVRKGVKRINGPAFALNIAVDALLKKEFDAYRQRGEPHPIFARYGLDMIPFRHAMLDQWTHNFTGVRWTDPTTGWTLYGAIDDLWLNRATRMLHTADYKATAKKDDPTTETLYGAYGRQQEIYGFLLRQQDLEFPVSDRNYFYYVNGDKTPESFGGALTFRDMIVPRDGNADWVLPKFREAVMVATSDEVPAASADCEWCAYRAQALAMTVPVGLAA